MALQRFIFFVSFTMFSVNVRASGQTGDDIDWANILPALFIVSCILGAIWLYRYVKRQQRNNVLPMLWMNSSILKGRLRNMVVLLEDSIGASRQDGSVDYAACSFCLAVSKKQDDINDLIKHSGVGRQISRKINQGFVQLNRAVICYQSFEQIEEEQNASLDKERFMQFRSDIFLAIELFESVIPDIYE